MADSIPLGPVGGPSWLDMLGQEIRWLIWQAAPEWLQPMLRGAGRDAITPVADPAEAGRKLFDQDATQRDVAQAVDRVVAETASKQDVSGLGARLDHIQAILEAQNREAGLAPKSEAEQRSDAGALAAFFAPDPEAAARVEQAIAGNDRPHAVALMKQQLAGREAEVNAQLAEQYRAIGLGARGADTAEAAAYEEAHRLQPEDFWTCVELARLCDEAGRLREAMEVARSAQLVAKGERELSPARERYEAGLAVSERLAALNPGSAEAQRDLIVSFAKLGGTFPGEGWWAKGLKIGKRLAAEGRLAPADAWMVDDLRKRAAEDG
ncbi:MAG: hypothetical protein KTR21_12765 [Rhodobacteraceae bacterium]|nr:hypothetical protein [Paracoccaceae bacterium]